ICHCVFVLYGRSPGSGAAVLSGTAERMGTRSNANTEARKYCLKAPPRQLEKNGGRRSRIVSCAHPGRSVAVTAMDKFEEIFKMQDALNRRIGVDLPPAGAG